MKSTTAFAAAAVLMSAMFSIRSVGALPLDARDVFVPPVLYPHAGTVWGVGQQHHVVWDTSNAPKQITNGKGVVMLRKANITTPLILGEGFDILLGRVQVTVPWVIEGDDYQLVLFGDSGNFSPFFTIQGGGI
ncbi:unnamed protein product [Mycena citricolor]|uniref:Uncharacterized protein n=1 Tax=Mycena citricolor TaxID=2018698 RepID=A0AAD2K7J7_9AGAR|nr:unnamed protein product [Mycena citricolor]CAK5283466.1 unnamed protein product [Mycena citricolor]